MTAWRPLQKPALADRRSEALTALVWLTRLPVMRLLPDPLPSLSACAWAFPLAGLAVALPAALLLHAALGLGMSPLIAAILAVALLIRLTGALHEDGLADYADGCGGPTKERRLEIMRDSRIGSYGVLALVLMLGLRVAALAQLGQAAPLLAAGALVAAAVLSRAGMAVALAAMVPARPDGLGRSAGRVTARGATCAVALALALLICCAWLAGMTPTAILLAPLVCAAAQALLARHARRLLGGQTGDVLGAIQQMGEGATLLALVVAA